MIRQLELEVQQLIAKAEQADRTPLRYPEDTAGGVRSNRFIARREDMMVEEVCELLLARAQERDHESRRGAGTFGA